MAVSSRRLFFGAGSALVLAAIVAGLATSTRAVTVSARNRASIAAARLESTLARRDDSTRAISLAYVERARLGLGSPYRLVEQAVHDPRLDNALRVDVAWSIVDRLLAGRVYEIDPRTLDPLGKPAASAGYLAIVEDAITSQDDPRVGEAATRIAYGLAAANGTTSMTSLAVVAEVAAQVRDRVLALRDMRRVLSRADADGVDVVDEVIHLRTTRELEVEQPLLRPLTAAQREAAIDAAAEILERVESVAVTQLAAAPAATLLDKPAATALARIAARMPPLAATRVVVTGRSGTLRADSTLGRSAVAVINAAANEESLVAAYAYADEISGGRSATLPRLMVSVGVALRAHAQDRVWFPGDPAPSVGSVIGRFALKSITFDRDVPRSWRPFYTRMIASGIEDFGRAVPGYDPAGLSFHVDMGALPDSALALHDPRTHTIRLSAMTPSGTLAHELAHDVDWQAGRRLFAKSGGYATDRSVRESTIRLSSSMRGLTSARLAGHRISPHGSGRPAEVFARSVDWFVADALATAGLSNGYLTAIEDPLLAGFAATPNDAASLDAATSLMKSIAEMTWVPDSAASGYVRRWESLELLDPSTVLMRVMDAPVANVRAPRLPFGMPAAVMSDLAAGAVCRIDAMREGSAQERLLAMSVVARARGILQRRARYMAAGTRPAWARALLGDPMTPPGASDDLLHRTIASVAMGAARAGLLDYPPAPFAPRCG
jgi:hypothetical protein